MASRKRGAIYIGVTNDIVRRAWEHRTGVIRGFTKKYNCKRLVWFESGNSIEGAIWQEKRLKNWRRSWKIDLIEQSNPEWRDLYPELVGYSHGAQ